MTGTQICPHRHKSGQDVTLHEDTDLWDVTVYEDTDQVSTLLSKQDTQSFINYQNTDGVTEQVIVSRCNIDRSTLRPVKGMRPSQSSSLLCVVTSNSRIMMVLLHCKFLSVRDTSESHTEQKVQGIRQMVVKKQTRGLGFGCAMN